MRKFSMFLLLATTAVPAMAAPDEEGGRQGRQSSQEQSDNRPARAERAERADRPERAQRNEAREQVQVQRQVQLQPQIQVERQNGGQRNGAFVGTRDRQNRDQQVQQDGQSSRDARMQQYRQQMEARRAQLGGQQTSEGDGLVARQGRYRPVPDINPNAGQPTPENRDGRLTGRTDHRDRPQWVNNWRNDNRYDWRRYRDRHHSTFHIGFYYDPFGYGYQRYGLGSFLNAGYYQSNYWINDPWQYRLPPAYGPYRWVRYHDDALLIDTWSGEVVDVIYGFFW